MKITEQPIVYRLAAMDEVNVHRDIEYAPGPSSMSISRPMATTSPPSSSSPDSATPDSRRGSAAR
jgi:hypothetical protein